ncbi:hypothetical protein ROM83_04450 [Cronobacter sakazakii]|uniref:hypothetical protein n=1 Tax=Cronobacter sakazakii TaxID=28141 RepID=UPI0028938EAA|nr:hypothetical protein [Cronobacter sakazakii]MDT3523227.1 hypothetical protein [Cronobacter sakazakii]
MIEISKERVEALASNILECHDVKPSEVKALAGLALLALRERAEPVAWLVYGSKTFKDRTASTREVAEQAVKDRNDGSSIKPLYTVPPAPVVPEWTNQQCLEFLAIAFRHAEIKGDFELDDLRLGVKMANAITPGKEG